ncbi:MAG: acyl-CoA/acyl-ACP dehydrogenase [Planctomycetota bacterium]|nr:acyl-CoA/acyl-ACP dehydrogenase [Planctomycetaceae bacterium]MDQ3333368.1 acyl-CoA/acyl-ACP dehydrogenase [Planctomycetota bacterium]
MHADASRQNDARGDGPASERFARLHQELRSHTAELEEADASCAAQLDRMVTAGVMKWGIPAQFGGQEMSAADQVANFERLAAACLVSAFVLSQRNAAVSRIVASNHEPLRADLLPKLAAHELMTTVGISHLTTSRQHLGRPSVSVTPHRDGYLFDGEVPWVTAASISDLVLTGGTLSDGRQLLALVPTDDPTVTVGAAPPLLALNASQTGSLSPARTFVGRERIVAGPIEGVIKAASGGTGSVTTSALAVGAAAGVLEHFAREVEKRPELAEIAEPLAAERAAISQAIREHVEATSAERAPSESSESIRHRANSLVLRASQAYLAASKGAGFVKGHPAERAVREAMFFLVWSCPQPVVNAALRQFACLTG